MAKNKKFGKLLKERIDRTIQLHEAQSEALSQIPGVLGKMAMEDVPEIQQMLAQMIELGRKSMANLDSVKGTAGAAAGHIAEHVIEGEEMSGDLRTLSTFADMVHDYVFSQLIFNPDELSNVIGRVDIPVWIETLEKLDPDRRAELLKAFT